MPASAAFPRKTNNIYITRKQKKKKNSIPINKLYHTQYDYNTPKDVTSEKKKKMSNTEFINSQGQVISEVRVHSLWNEFHKSLQEGVRTPRFDLLLQAIGPTSLTAKFRVKHDRDPRDIVHRIVAMHVPAEVEAEAKGEDEDKGKKEEEGENSEGEEDDKKKKKSKKQKEKERKEKEKEKEKEKKKKGKKGKRHQKEDSDDDDSSDSDSDSDDDEEDKNDKGKGKGEVKEEAAEAKPKDPEIEALENPEFHLVLGLLKKILRKYRSFIQLVGKEVYVCLRHRWSQPRAAIFYDILKAHDLRVMKDHYRETISDMDDFIHQARRLRGTAESDVLVAPRKIEPLQVRSSGRVKELGVALIVDDS